MQTCQCDMQRFLKVVKMIFLDEKYVFLIIARRSWVQKRPNNLCFEQK